MNSSIGKSKLESAAGVEPRDTAQTAVWEGDFGRDYTDRNTFDTAALEELYRKNYGTSRREINERFLSGIPKDARILEVGCNTGNQILLLHEMGYSNLSGIELQSYAAEIARSRVPSASIQLGSALSLPYADASFDVVFTSGVLIHVAPAELPRVMDEIHRCSRSYIWGAEYYAPDATEVSYRGRGGLLWKMDYAQRYLERFPDLELALEQRLPYLENANVDAVFLLKKTVYRSS